MEELVKSLHDYVRKTDLSFDDGVTRSDFLTRTGQKCTSSRQEFILLSDVLGFFDAGRCGEHRERDGATESTVLARSMSANTSRCRTRGYFRDLPGERMS